MKTNSDVAIILAAAIRYSLGRHSYMPNVVQGFLRRNLNNRFIRREIPLYITDIENYLNENENESPDNEGWAELLKELKEAHSDI